jgi:hypothetical protein
MRATSASHPLGALDTCALVYHSQLPLKGSGNALRRLADEYDRDPEAWNTRGAPRVTSLSVCNEGL